MATFCTSPRGFVVLAVLSFAMSSKLPLKYTLNRKFNTDFPYRKQAQNIQKMLFRKFDFSLDNFQKITFKKGLQLALFPIFSSDEKLFKFTISPCRQNYGCKLA